MIRFIAEGYGENPSTLWSAECAECGWRSGDYRTPVEASVAGGLHTC